MASRPEGRPDGGTAFTHSMWCLGGMGIFVLSVIYYFNYRYQRSSDERVLRLTDRGAEE